MTLSTAPSTCSLPSITSNGDAVQQAAVRGVHLRPQGDVDHPALVLQGDEDEVLGGHRVLDTDPQPGDPDARPVAQPGGIGDGDHAALGEPLPEQLHRVEVRADAGLAVVGGDPLRDAHGRQGSAQRTLGVIGQAQRGTRRIRVGEGGAQLPEELAAWHIGPVEGTDADEPLHNLLAQPGAGHEVAHAAVRTDARSRSSVSRARSSMPFTWRSPSRMAPVASSAPGACRAPRRTR